jgi:hypothetical protein
MLECMRPITPTPLFFVVISIAPAPAHCRVTMATVAKLADFDSTQCSHSRLAVLLLRQEE